jgi:transposase
MTSGETITISRSEYQELLGYKSEVQWLKHQLEELKRLIYGPSRERFIPQDPLQPALFEFPAKENPEQEQENITYTRTKPQPAEKKHPLRAELPSHLPRRDEIIEPENIPEGAKKIGEAVTEILEYKAASIYVRRIIRPKYIVESIDEATIIKIADLPSLLIHKGNAGASLVAHILVSKFCDHLPYFRQSKIFKRQGLHIPDSTIGGWANVTIKNWLVPLYETTKKRLLESDYLMADETPIPVLSEDKPGSTHRGYLWVYYDPVKKLVCFDYRMSRERAGPKSFLKEFTGYLQSDGYSAYKDLGPPGKIEHLACMAHARRKFEHSLKNDKKKAETALTLIGALYDIEREARNTDLSFDRIKELRQQKAVPILKEFEEWLLDEKPGLLPKSAIGAAVNYTLELWPRLKRYVEDGRFHIDNNLIENSIRPVALGRKNFLFAGSHEAAIHIGVIYSLLATCKIRDVESYAWLKNALEVIPDYPVNQLEELLPHKI